MPRADDRNLSERRRAKEWCETDRRRGGDRREDAFRDFARRLPAEFVKLHGSPRERVMRLVNEYCRGCDESLQADLAQALLPTLQTVVTGDGGVVTEEHQRACEVAVEHCVRKNELDTDRWDTNCNDGPQ